MYMISIFSQELCIHEAHYMKLLTHAATDQQVHVVSVPRKYFRVIIIVNCTIITLIQIEDFN